MHSTTDDNALRAKVDEAMNVYNEYVKNRSDNDDLGGANGADIPGSGHEEGA